MGDRILIHNALLWTAAGRDPIPDGGALIEGGRIAETGRRLKARADIRIDADGCLLMPGFVQTHVHLCQTLFRGAAEDEPLLPWLRRYIWPLEAAHDEESIAVSARLACAELIRGGTTTFLSMETVRYTSAVFEAVAETGLTGILSHCLMDETGGYAPLAVPIEDSLAECDLLLQRWGEHPRLGLAVAPRFALSCSEANLREAAAYARDRGLRLHTHSSEQAAEVELVLRRTGRRNVDYLHQVGISGPEVCLAHCVHVSAEEQALLAETRTRVLHCPSANCKLGSGIAPIPELLARGVEVSLGADGAACNNRLDMFEEMRMAGLLQKLRLGPEALPAREIVRLATEGGARALGLDAEIGALDAGKRANLILVDISGPHCLPSDDPADTLVYAARASDVALVMADGRILFEDGRLTTVDEEALRAEARRQRRRLMERAGLA